MQCEVNAFLIYKIEIIMNTTSNNMHLRNILASLLLLAFILVSSCSHSQQSSDRNDSINKSLENVIIKELIKIQSPSGKKIDVYIKIDTAQYQHTLYINDQPMKFLNTGFEGYEDDPLDESDVFRMAYFKSPDRKWLFVMLRPSIAGSCDIFYKLHLYRIDLETYQVDFLFNCGAFQLTDDGFMAAHQVECINEDEYTCCADMRFSAQLIYYDFNGEEIKRGKVMEDNEILSEFSEESQLYNIEYIDLTETLN